MSGHGSVYREEAFWAEAEEEEEEGHVGASLRRQMLHDLGGVEPPHEQPQNLRNGEAGYDTTDGGGDGLRGMGRRCAAAAAAAAHRRRTARGGSESGDEGGRVAGPVLRLTRGGWLPDAASAMPAGEAMGEETYCRLWAGAGRAVVGAEGELSTEEDGAEGRGDGVPLWVGEAAAAEEEAEEAVLGAAFLPMRGATVPLFYFSLRMDVFVGAAEVGAAVGPSVDPGEAAVAAAEEEEEVRQEEGKGEAERGGGASMERQQQERVVVAEGRAAERELIEEMPVQEKAAASPRGRLTAEQSWEDEEGLWRSVAQGEGWEAANAAVEALSLDERVAGWSLSREGKSADAALQASSLAVGVCARCLHAACTLLARCLHAACVLHVRCMCTACALHALHVHCVCTARRALRRGRLQRGQPTGRMWTIRTKRSWPMLRPCRVQRVRRARRAPRQRCHPGAVRQSRKRWTRRARRRVAGSCCATAKCGKAGWRRCSRAMKVAARAVVGYA